MRIIHIITGLSTAGAQISLYKLLMGMDRTRFDPVVISLTSRETLSSSIEALGIPVYVLGINASVSALRSIGFVLCTVKQLRPDLIQGWMYHGNLAAQLVRSVLGRELPVFWNIRGAHYILRREKPLTAFTIWLGARLSKSPSTIVYNSEKSALMHERHLGYSPRKRVVIPNGFDTGLFSPSLDARRAVRSELGISQGALLVGSVGRYHLDKDHSCLLRGFALLKDKYPCVQLILIGKGMDSANRVVQKLINDLGLNCVHLLGERQDIPRLTASLDIAVSSSNVEGFSNVVGEAMSCAVPCVVTDVGDSAAIVGETGRIVPARNPEELALAISELIEMDAVKRHLLGLLARERIAKRFSLPFVVSRYQELYQSAFAV